MWRRVLIGLVVLLAVLAGAAEIWARSEFAAAQQAIHDEHYADARVHLQHCLKVPWWLCAKTRVLEARLERIFGHYDQASALLAACDANQPDVQFELLLLQAEQGAGLGNTVPNELRLWQIAVDEHHPEAAQVYRSLAKIALKQHRADFGLGALQRWIELKPDSAEALEWRGVVNTWLLNETKAEDDFRAALALDPNRDSARYELVKLLVTRNRDPQEIADEVAILLEHQPQEPKYLLAMSRCKMMASDFAAARRLLDDALEVDPKNYLAMELYGDLEFQSQDFAKAESWYRKALKAGSLNHKIYAQLADSLDRQGSKKTAEVAELRDKSKQVAADLMRIEELLGGELQKSKYAPEKMVELGTILLRGKQDQAAINWLYEALHKDPHNKDAHELLAKYFAKSDLPRSRYHAEQAKLSAAKTP